MMQFSPVKKYRKRGEILGPSGDSSRFGKGD